MVLQVRFKFMCCVFRHQSISTLNLALKSQFKEMTYRFQIIYIIDIHSLTCFVPECCHVLQVTPQCLGLPPHCEGVTPQCLGLPPHCEGELQVSPFSECLPQSEWVGHGRPLVLFLLCVCVTTPPWYPYSHHTLPHFVPPCHVLYKLVVCPLLINIFLTFPRHSSHLYHLCDI